MRRLRASGSARIDIDAIGNHEGRIEADAELADELGAFSTVLLLLRGFDALDKGFRAGARDRAECIRHVVTAHADAVILDRQRILIGIERDGDVRLGVLAEKFGTGDRLVPQLLAGVRRIGDELAKKNLLVRIDRMDHQMQEFCDIRLERASLCRRGLCRRGLGGCFSGRRGVSHRASVLSGLACGVMPVG